jgi:PAS domain S-box-containing protein
VTSSIILDGDLGAAAMSQGVQATFDESAVGGGRPRTRRWLVAAATVAAVYYGGAKIGLALTFNPFPLSVLWPPNALLLACLLLAPRRWWWLLIAAAFPAHLLAELQGGVPIAMVLCWFVSNVVEALIGALFVRQFASSRPTLGTVRDVVVFTFAALLASVLSSFLDASFVRFVGWRDADYWSLWHARVFSNLLATLTFVPIALTWAAAGRARLRRIAEGNLLEAALLLVGLLGVSFATFDSGTADPTSSTSLLYLPIPFLLWAALRFGPQMTSASFAVVAFSVIWGAGHGNGPFLQAAAHEDAYPIQLFLISLAVPMLLLAAVIEERQRVKDLFSTAFHSSPDAIAISRRSDDRILEANDRWLELLGYRRDDLARDLIAPLSAHVDDAGRKVLAALERGSPDAGDVEVTVADSRGTERQMLIRVGAAELGGEPCVIAILRDISAQRQAELQAHEHWQQLTHLSRVASLIGLSSTLAHELNQPLTAILANVQAALRHLSRESPDMGELNTILGEIADADQRAGQLIRHMGLLMKPGEETYASTDVNQLVRDLLGLLHGEFVKRDVDVLASFAPGLAVVRGDRVQLQQIVLNLVCNAYEAMEGNPRGHRTLEVWTAFGHDETVQVLVRDNGPGIAADTADRIFDPFFTTKGNGIGLGLPISLKIARAHGGDIVAEPRDGGGATFRLVLPSSGRPAAERLRPAVEGEFPP